MNRKERRASASQTRKGKAGSRNLSIQLAEAIALAQSGKLAEAEPILEAARKADVDDPEVKHQLGMIYVRTGRADPGIALLREAVEAKPAEALYWNNLAAAYLSLEMSDQAVEASRKATGLDPKYVTAWQNLAFGLRDLTDHAGAADAFARAEKLEELEPGSLASWGESLGSIGRHAEGEAVVRRALAKTPEDPAILTLLGWLLNEQNKRLEAIDVFGKSLELKPDQFLAAFNYALLQLNRDPEVALRWLRRATSIDPRNPSGWRMLALELAKRGLKDEALPATERALRLAPNDASLQDLLRKLKGEPETAAPAAAAPEVGPNEIVIEFDDEPAAPAEAAPAAAPAAPAATPKPDFKPQQSTGILDLSVLKIG